MDANLSIWHYYQPNFVHPDFVPYLRHNLPDSSGHYVNINTWEKQGPPHIVQPELVRVNWGMKFVRRNSDIPCPPGFIPSNTEGEEGYCYPRPKDYEPVFYTNKAFIAKNQYWDSYIQQPMIQAESITGKVPIDSQPYISESFDMRSINPLTGKYNAYFLPSRNTGKYGMNPTPESYLG